MFKSGRFNKDAETLLAFSGRPAQKKVKSTGHLENVECCGSESEISSKLDMGFRSYGVSR